MSDRDKRMPDELKAWPGHSGNWGRWPNERGTLNLLTPAVALRGLAEARTGEVINCARRIVNEDPVRPTPAVTHKMMTAGDQAIEVQSAKDEISYRIHGLANTHIDAISHYGFRNLGFNGHRFGDLVTMEDGATRWDIAATGPIVTRGIFVDVARMRGVRNFEPGDWVRVEEIRAAAERIEPGDAFVIRTGATLDPFRRTADFGSDPHAGVLSTGIDPECIELLGRKDVSVVCSDSASERLPVRSPDLCRAPVHVLTLTIYGMHLLHNMDLEALGDACERDGRSSFLLMVSPLASPRATGSLVSPVAVL